MFCLSIFNPTIGSAYGSALPNIPLASSSTPHGLVSLFIVEVRIEWREREEGLVEPPFLVNDTFHR